MEANTVFLAKIDLLHAMLLWIRERLGDLDAPTIRKVELASEEAIVNIIQHAYQHQPEKIEIELKFHPQSHVEIAFKDYGPPFDPTKKRKDLDRTASLEQREVGGLGLHFIHHNMDEVRYRRERDKNVLVLVKRFTRSSHKA
ncbi:MAG TPA: ATP-binding protein [Chlamydiales bacterium]|nr:ATP-binding protein [Chlamydiales bacterium]